jgi:hypothetical protein
MDLLKLRWGEVDWIGLAEDKDKCRALVNLVLNLHVPGDAGKLSSVLTTWGLSCGAQLHGVSLVLKAILNSLVSSSVVRTQQLFVRIYKLGMHSVTLTLLVKLSRTFCCTETGLKEVLCILYIKC